MHGGEGRIEAALAELTVDRSRLSNRLALVLSALVVGLTWSGAPPFPVIAWLLAKAAVSALRILAERRFDAVRADPAKAVALGRQYEIGLGLDGAVYGLLAILPVPDGDPKLGIVLVATVVGIGAVGHVLLSASYRASLAFELPLLLPGVLVHLAGGDRVSVFIGGGMALFVVLVVVEGRRVSDHMREMLSMRFRMDDMAQQLQRALELAQQGSEKKSRFLATMSHEIRGPLHGVLGLARLLEADKATGGERQRAEYLRALEHTGQHLLTIINEVLDHASIEAGRLKLAPQPLDLGAFLNDTLGLFAAQARDKGLVLDLDLQLPAPCTVLADPMRLRQVLINLLGNALKFTVRGQIVVRACRLDGGNYRIDVSDSGPGVAAGDRERIFLAFEQAGSPRAFEGTGLGLPISREIAAAMGGSLACHESSEGGATFRLDLPLPDAPARAATQPGTPTDSVDHGRTGPRVLVAEDNDVNAMVVEDLLCGLGASVVVVSDGAAAVEHVSREHFDLVLMDCQMPRMDGYEATARIRADEILRGRCRVPVIALTANILARERDRALEAGMDEQLSKPFTEAQLRALLERYVPTATAQGRR